MCAQFMSFEPRTCSETTWNYMLICDELEMIKALVKHHGQTDLQPCKYWSFRLTSFELNMFLAFFFVNPLTPNLFLA